ncbi:MAG: PD-(D/E)XK nuclease family protein, partial [Phycisphaerales bacterium]|nr:PD-(D/E)XK nuclease family protein [Phycisphaerales bacterium]
AKLAKINEFTVQPPPADKSFQGHGVAASSPSSLEGGGKVKVSERFDAKTNTSFSWGTVIHSWFEKIEWFDGRAPSIESLIASAPPEEAGHLGKEKLRAAAESFVEAISGDSLKALLTKPQGQVSVFNEQSFALRVSKGTDFANISMKELTDLQGSIDRLVVYYDEDGSPTSAEVIDWKTDLFDPDERERKIEHYAPQLESYRFAASKLLGISGDQISTKLVFLKTQEIAEIGKNTPCGA